jgi:hypothetical protein
MEQSPHFLEIYFINVLKCLPGNEVITVLDRFVLGKKRKGAKAAGASGGQHPFRKRTFDTLARAVQTDQFSRLYRLRWKSQKQIAWRLRR